MKSLVLSLVLLFGAQVSAESEVEKALYECIEEGYVETSESLRTDGTVIETVTTIQCKGVGAKKLTAIVKDKYSLKTSPEFDSKNQAREIFYFGVPKLHFAQCGNQYLPDRKNPKRTTERPYCAFLVKKTYKEALKVLEGLDDGSIPLSVLPTSEEFKKALGLN